MITRSSHFKWLFLGIVVLDIIVGSLGPKEYRMITKPLLLVSLLIYFAVNGKQLSKPTYMLMLLALGLSLSGDVLLLFDHGSANFFIYGLISFLLAHIAYSVLFLKKWNKKKTKNFIGTGLLLAVYGGALFFYLKDSLGPLKLPVIVYILGILFMAMTALGRFAKVPSLSFVLVLAGALCFVASDSILAIDKFIFEVPAAHILIMGTYAAAQYLIVMGVLRQNADL